ncbi:hypothetical protein KQI88_14465 [Alkaliphilus sp. MSJ-5]|uniref:Uncharacterized protein n=1 Tax=Alkaliphilus flagellatus TaxID=2841507 RepID=A0ABS6G7M4_9FIRM|nr:hypothetical protein [Alkaliphilus flagellatus]MBU5677623.1 hypothetical protein [Alkaliphilus flagellatus]
MSAMTRVHINTLINISTFIQGGYRIEKPTKEKVLEIIEWLRNPNEDYLKYLHEKANFYSITKGKKTSRYH